MCVCKIINSSKGKHHIFDKLLTSIHLHKVSTRPKKSKIMLINMCKMNYAPHDLHTFLFAKRSPSKITSPMLSAQDLNSSPQK